MSLEASCKRWFPAKRLTHCARGILPNLLRNQLSAMAVGAVFALLVCSPCSADPAQPPGETLEYLAAHNQPTGQIGSQSSEVNKPAQHNTSDGDGPSAGDAQAAAPLWVPSRRPTSDFQFDYYRDSDGNNISTLTSQSTVSVGRATFTLMHQEVDASGAHGSEGSEATVISGYGKLRNWLLVGGGLGVIYTMDGSSSMAGSLTSTINFKSISITMGLARGLLEATAQTISAHVMQTDFNASIWDSLTDHLGADIELHHRILSDGNSENDFSIAPDYSFDVWKTKLALDWALEYANFAQPTKLGYYAPQGLLSTQPSLTWKFDKAGYYGMLKIGVGRKFQMQQSQWMASFAGTAVAAIGKRLSERVAAEVYLIAGRDAMGVPAAWNSMNSGFKLNYSF